VCKVAGTHPSPARWNLRRRRRYEGRTEPDLSQEGEGPTDPTGSNLGRTGCSWFELVARAARNVKVLEGKELQLNV
jgi:hypothetical protein